jgi:hypothetical protein
MPVIDKRESYVLNVNGHPIYYGTFKHKIEEDLRKINLMFVLEGKESTIQRFPAVVNAIQGLQSQLANDESFLSSSAPCLPSTNRTTGRTLSAS